MNRAVRTGLPDRVTSATSITPRPTVTSRRRPARVAGSSYVRGAAAPASTTISTLSPRIVFAPGSGPPSDGTRLPGRGRRTNCGQRRPRGSWPAVDHPLRKILEKRGDQLFWKEGTAFAGQELNYAHTLPQASVRNIGAPEALASAPEKLEPVGRRLHLSEYGHKADLVTNHLRNATEEVRAAAKAGTKDLAVSRIPKARAGQAGCIEIKGLAFLAILSATGVVILRSSADRTEAVAELVKFGADLALQSIIVRALGGGAGFAVSVVLGMHSDDSHLNRQHAIETAQYDAVHKFIDQYLPQTVTVDKGVIWDSRRYDPLVVEQVHDLMFAVPPTRLPTPSP